jgi:hypothetical protein
MTTPNNISVSTPISGFDTCSINISKNANSIFPKIKFTCDDKTSQKLVNKHNLRTFERFQMKEANAFSVARIVGGILSLIGANELLGCEGVPCYEDPCNTWLADYYTVTDDRCYTRPESCGQEMVTNFVTPFQFLAECCSGHDVENHYISYGPESGTLFPESNICNGVFTVDNDVANLVNTETRRRNSGEPSCDNGLIEAANEADGGLTPPLD